MRIVVLGSRGQLGSAIVDDLRDRHEVVAFDHAALDVTDASATLAAVAAAAPDAVINCTGFNAVDAAETAPVDAFRLNAIAVRTLARAAEARGAALVHFSSDFVFDGQASAPYVESDRPNPRSVYAASKLAGEWLAAETARAYVLRVESLFGCGSAGPDKGTVATIVKGLASGTSPTVMDDRTVSPSYVVDIARATRRLLEARLPFGLYHAVSSSHCTWLELALEAARLLEVEPRMRVVRMSDVPLPAARPQYSVLSNDKLAAVGITMPSWQDALARHLRRRPAAS